MSLYRSIVCSKASYTRRRRSNMKLITRGRKKLLIGQRFEAHHVHV